ncbi:hypothetical protein EV578_115105 [Streptomyces sp. BK205]|nr:hypothetical protein EV578_115105 [Streptomyces sp. BK205]
MHGGIQTLAVEDQAALDLSAKERLTRRLFLISWAGRGQTSSLPVTVGLSVLQHVSGRLPSLTEASDAVLHHDRRDGEHNRTVEGRRQHVCDRTYVGRKVSG